jgi:hypothetical protein
MRLVFPFIAGLIISSAAQAQVNIVTVGDSNIRGKGVPESQAYPAQLEQALRARGHNVVIRNEGINGDTTDGVLRRLESAVPSGTHIAIVSVGVNDVLLHGRTPQQAGAGVQAIVQRLKRRGVEVYVIDKMQLGIFRRNDLHVEAAWGVPGTTNWHLNANGYAVVVGRTLPAIEQLVLKAEKRRSR